MKVLGVVVTFNGSTWINDCLRSLTKSVIPIDIFVIDNQSTDNTITIIENNFPQINLLKSEENIGFGKANNIGLEKALEEHYDYVFLLNQDAWIELSTIQVLIDRFAENPSFGILSPVHLNKAKNKLESKFALYICRNKDKSFLSDVCLPTNTIQHIYPIDFVNAAAWLISRECIEKVGGFDPLFPHYGEDNDYIIRAQYYGFKVGFVPVAFVVHDRDGYTKQIDVERSLAKQYIDQLKILKNINLPYRTTLFLTLRKEIKNAIISIFKLDLSLFMLKCKLIFKILLHSRSIAKSRAYCKSNHTAYLYQ
jgi:GT2 family glycosyltransferase